MQSACSKLNQAIAFQPNEYEILYNAGMNNRECSNQLGTSYLLLASSKTESDPILSIQFLGNACEKFEKALDLR